MKQNAGRVFLRAFAYDNVVLVQALGLCPIIAAGISLQRGVALAVCTAAVLLPSSLLMTSLGKKLPPAVRTPLYTILAMVMMVLCGWVMSEYISPELYASLYIYLPLMSVNTLFTYHAGGFSVGHKPMWAIADTLGTAAGFGVVICIISALREMASAGTLWGIPLGYDFRFTEAAYPYAAFILLAFMAALLQHLKMKYMHTLVEQEAIIRE
jgi:electron transport complex protein RnfE